MALIIAYFLLSIELYLATYCVGVFRLSFSIWGPTELRIVLAIGTFVLFWKPIVRIAGAEYFLCDVAGSRRDGRNAIDGHREYNSQHGAAI